MSSDVLTRSYFFAWNGYSSYTGLLSTGNFSILKSQMMIKCFLEQIQPIFETCNAVGVRPPLNECHPNNRCGQNAQCVLDNDFIESCICTTGYEYVDNNCQDIDECKAGTHECGNAECFNLEGTYRCTTTVDVVWAVDGTTSYKDYVSTAEANFKEQIEYFKSKREEGNGIRLFLDIPFIPFIIQ